MESDLATAYRASVYKTSALLISKLLWICVSLAIFYGIYDYFQLGPGPAAYSLVALRIVAAVAFGILVWRFRRCSSLAEYDRLGGALLIVVQATLFLASLVRPEYHHYLLDILWIFGAYTFLHLPLAKLSIPILVFSIANLANNVFIHPLNTRETTLAVLMTGLANLVGFLSARYTLTLGTERMRLQRQLEQEKNEVQTQNRINETLMSLIAHDLRTPIGNLALSLEHILEIEDTSVRDQALRGMLGDFKLVHLTFDNLIVWARGLRGRLEPIPERFDVAEAVDEESRLLASSLRSKDIRTTFQIPPGATLNWDRQMFKSCVRNLLSNAGKYSPRGSAVRVVVHADARSQAYELFVENGGPGIPAEKREDLFREFSPQRKTTQPEKGFGMGLYLCRLMAEANGGSIECDSAPGKYTRFTIHLAPEEGAAALNRATTAAP